MIKYCTRSILPYITLAEKFEVHESSGYMRHTICSLILFGSTLCAIPQAFADGAMPMVPAVPVTTVLQDGTDAPIEKDASMLSIIRSSGEEYFAVKAAIGTVPAGGVAGPLAPVLELQNKRSGDGVLSQACVPMRRFSLTGSIALVMQGSCDFTTKFRHLEAAGAIGAIVIAEPGQSLIVMGANDEIVQPQIPAFMVRYGDLGSLQANSGIATMLPSAPTPTATLAGLQKNRQAQDFQANHDLKIRIPDAFAKSD